jgi:hypothetical protein
MEDTIGECTNLHITYPALVLGYRALLRANRTVADALEAPESDDADESESDEIKAEGDKQGEIIVAAGELSTKQEDQIKANDIAITSDGKPSFGIIRFHAALSEMTARRGIRDEISRYEAMTVALIEPKGSHAGSVFSDFPSPTDSGREPLDSSGS